MPKIKILIVDDDSELNQLLSAYLQPFNFEVVTASNGRDGLKALQRENPSLIILDIMLPEMNGFEVCREIRKTSSVPVIILTARGDLNDRIVGLELGGDDYLAKPYEPRELVARIQSVLRRTQSQVSPQNNIILRSHELLLNLGNQSATLNNQNLLLTDAEFAVLRILLQNPGQTLTRDCFFQQLRGMDWNSMDRSIDVVISRLRNKLKDDTKEPRYLKTVWGLGYKFVGKVSNEAIA